MARSTNPRAARQSKTSQRLAALVGSVALVAAPLVVAPVAVLPAAAVDGSVSGTVFHDFNSNGILDPDPGDPALPRDRGFAGVTVTAYDRDDSAVGTTTSGADGTYTVAVTGADTDALRIEFTDLPQGYFPSFSVLGASAGESGSNVQLVDVGATDVDFGVNVPDEYSVAGADTPVATSLAYAGQRQYQVNPNNPEQGVSLAAWPWQTAATSPGAANDFNFVNNGAYPGPYFGLPESRTPLATFDETGGIWGTAAQGSTGDLFAAAVLRRQVDLGPGGLATVYRVPDVYDPATGLIGSPGPIETWLNLGPALTADGQNGVPNDVPGLGIDFGTFDATYAGRGGFIRPQDPAADTAAYTGVGTLGIGGVAVSADQTKLYVMNLHLREIEVIDIASKTLDQSIPSG
ncbi:hypothetical protein GCM10025865_13330 [Paraoerskovia sediminicola]|uniref:SD-repeat containing protein B domain-containing protein n=1 Tax=Paraoerskovia sediminicola TaxID=1138587 RepID=A0ABN6XB16_9CELL|nr:SdrD B-like domain-containing protein [Paraoerskovia sediminicola]BDZ42034.1 hypothetical protein GCM10025865_13330 [Paraoerskovia sediminicola]